jgi:hypothetical protein
MFSLPRMQLLSLAAAAGVLVISGTPTMADELATNLGPVEPHEPILTAVGSKRVIAFYEPDNGRCAVQAIVYDTTDAYTGMTTAARHGFGYLEFCRDAAPAGSERGKDDHR